MFTQQLVVSHCIFFSGIIDLQYCFNWCRLPSDIFIRISIIHDSISSQVDDK